MDEESGAARPASWRRYVPLGVVVLAMAAVFASGLHRQISLETLVLNEGDLRAFVERNGLLAPIVYALIYAVVVALSLPAGAVLTVAAGAVFGLAAGAASVVVGATLGACVLFLVARSSFGAFLLRKAGPALARLADGFRKDAASYMLFLRLAPVFPFALVNLAPALLGVPFSTFAWTTALGILPGTLAFASIGAGLGSVVAREREALLACRAAGREDCALAISIGDLVTTETIVALALLALVALIPVALRRFAPRLGRAP
jgi:uncharacterized membrane protein YdjX (TVP38/TMEM64 family)